MRAHTITTTKLALLLSLLALGALGLVACGGGDDDQTTAASETETTRDELAADNKSCGRFDRYRFAVVEGDISCRVARRVMDGMVYGRPPGAWICSGSDSPVQCFNAAGAIRAHVHKDVLRRWRAAEARRVHIGGNAGDVAFITKVGNEWAPLFAKDVSAACDYMYGQPLCEEFFGRVGEPPEVRRPSGFQKSFANATVERVQVKDAKQIKTKDGTLIELHKAVSEFSNGELVEFIEETDAPRSDLGKWFVDDVGG